MPARMEGKVVLVTGAKSGIGMATSALLAKEGAHVFVGARKEGPAMELVEEIRGDGGSADFIQLDVTSGEDWAAALEKVRSSHGELHALVNNAAYGGNFDGIFVSNADPESLVEFFKTNVVGAHRGIQTFAPLMRDSGGGSIVNIGSIAGTTGHFVAAYATSKWAIRGLTQAAAAELVSWNIRVNIVHPGLTATPMHDNLDEFIMQMEEATPLSREAMPIEVAYPILWLASDEASYLTGSELTVDGGYTGFGMFRRVGEGLGLLEPIPLAGLAVRR